VAKDGKLSDKQFQARARDVERRLMRQRDDDLRELMSAQYGRRVAVWIIYELGRLQDESFDGSKRDGLNTALFTARAEGRRELAIDLHNELQRLAPDMVVRMLQERLETIQAEMSLESESDNV